MSGSTEVLHRLADLHDAEGIPVAVAVQTAITVFMGLTPRAREILVDALAAGPPAEMRVIVTHVNHAVSTGLAAAERQRRRTEEGRL